MKENKGSEKYCLRERVMYWHRQKPKKKMVEETQ